MKKEGKRYLYYIIYYNYLYYKSIFMACNQNNYNNNSINL